MLLLQGLVLKNVLNGMSVRDMSSLLDTRTRGQFFLPGLEVREFIDVDTSPTGCSNPSPVADVGDRHMVADQVAGFGSGEVLIEDAVQATGFVLVPIYSIFNALGSVAEEVVCLAWE